MIQLFERLKKLASTGEKVKLDSGLRVSKIELLKPLTRLDEKAAVADLVRSSSETLSRIKEESVKSIPTPKEEDPDAISKEDLKAEIEALIEADKRALVLFPKIKDYHFKNDNYGLMDTLKKDIQSCQVDLDIIESNSSQLMLRNISFSLYKRRLAIAEYHKRIEERYQMTTVDPNFRYDGTQTENSRWREEAMAAFPEIDLNAFTDLQLKYYVVAFRTMPNNIDIIRQAMNPARSPEHIRLLFNCVDDTLFAEILMHPEYSSDKIVSMMPSVLAAIEESKKSKQ